MAVSLVALLEKSKKKLPTPETVKEPLPWELQGNSVDEVISVLEEVLKLTLMIDELPKLLVVLFDFQCLQATLI